MSEYNHPDLGYKAGTEDTGERLPPDYQAHIDYEPIREKMVRLDREMKELLDRINNKVKPAF